MLLIRVALQCRKEVQTPTNMQKQPPSLDIYFHRMADRKSSAFRRQRARSPIILRQSRLTQCQKHVPGSSFNQANQWVVAVITEYFHQKKKKRKKKKETKVKIQARFSQPTKKPKEPASIIWQESPNYCFHSLLSEQGKADIRRVT